MKIIVTTITLFVFASLITELYSKEKPFEEKSYSEKLSGLEAIILEATADRKLSKTELEKIRDGVIDLQYTDDGYKTFSENYESRGWKVPISKQHFIDAEVIDLIPLLSLKEYSKLIDLMQKNKLLPKGFKTDLPKLYKEEGKYTRNSDET